MQSQTLESAAALARAAAAVGNFSRLAALCGVSPAAVSKWRRDGVTAERAIDIERVTNGAVTRHELRPDLYPPAAPGPLPPPDKTRRDVLEPVCEAVRIIGAKRRRDEGARRDAAAWPFRRQPEEEGAAPATDPKEVA